MSFEDTFSILDKINLIKQYLTGNVIMSSENLEGNKREKKTITFLHAKKKVCLHRVGTEGCSHCSPRLFRTVVEREQRIRLRNPLFYSAESSFESPAVARAAWRHASDINEVLLSFDKFTGVSLLSQLT